MCKFFIGPNPIEKNCCIVRCLCIDRNYKITGTDKQGFTYANVNINGELVKEVKVPHVNVEVRAVSDAGAEPAKVTMRQPWRGKA